MNDTTPSTDKAFSTSHQFSAEDVSRRAYQIWEEEGRPESNDLQHWLRAERELNSRSSREGATPQADPVRPPREQHADVRPLQGTPAKAAATRDGRRSSRSPFTAGKSSPGTATPSGLENAPQGKRW